MWPPRAPTISPSSPSTSLTAARPMPLAHQEGSLVRLPGTHSLPGGRACLFQVRSPPCWPAWPVWPVCPVWLSAGSGQVELLPQAGGGPEPSSSPEKRCRGRGQG